MVTGVTRECIAAAGRGERTFNDASPIPVSVKIA